jgi:tyrosinase
MLTLKTSFPSCVQVQFEIAHNAIHAWLGGSADHSMNTLHYASYDPAFIIHHAQTDRIFAIWQEMQKNRLAFSIYNKFSQ